MSDKDPITRASQSSNLPRQARARINQTTDPLPAGKILAAQPTHHMMNPIDTATQSAMEGTSLQQQEQNEGTDDEQLLQQQQQQQQQQRPSRSTLAARDDHKREVQKMHVGGRGGGGGGGGGGGHHGNKHLKPQQAGMDWLGATTAANKKMDSRTTHDTAAPTGGGGGGNHNKHLDTVYRSAGKGNQKKG